MNRKVTIVLVVLVCGLLSTPAWVWGMGGFGGGGHAGHAGGGHFSGGVGHFSGGFHSGFSGQGLHFGFGNPAFHSPGFSQFQHFPHGPLFAPPQWFGSVVPFAHGPQFAPRPFFGCHRHFMPRIFVLPPVGFASRSFFLSNGVGEVDSFVGEAVNPGYPFFCAVHGFGFIDQAQFFGHLNFAHHIPLDQAAAFCTLTEGGGLIFFGF